MPTSTPRKPLKSTTKVVATAAILLGVGALVTGGAFAVFTATSTGSVSMNAGALDMTLTAGNASHSFTFANLAPGDSVQRPVTVTLPAGTGNVGSLVGKVQLSFAKPTEKLGADPSGIDPSGSLVSGYSADSVGPLPVQLAGTSGMTYRVESCSEAWTTTSGTEAGPYTCLSGAHLKGGGNVFDIANADSTVTYTPAAADANSTAPISFDTDSKDVKLYSLITFTLPETAGNGFQNATMAVDFTAAAIQRAGIQR